MKRKYFKCFTVLLLIIVMTMTACGSKKDMSYQSKPEGTSTEEFAEDSLQSDYDGETSDTATSETTTEEKSTTEKKSTSNAGSVETNRKLIKRVEMEVETKDFEGLVNSINTKVERLQGYMESSEVNGNRYYMENNARYAHMVIRIPSTKLKEFVTAMKELKELGNVINSSDSTEDVTLEYIDTQSHKKVLQIEHERLLEILKSAKKLEDIFTIEERLSEVRYEIESYESQIRTYDNLVDYSTITLDINEVQHITPVEDKTVADRMKSGLSNSLFQIKTGFQNFAVWFVTNLPYLIIWAIIITLVTIIVKKRLKILYKLKTNIVSLNDQDMNKKVIDEEKTDKGKGE